MSGCAGGNRILREDVEATIFHYRHYVLSPYAKFVNSKITGSYNCSDKPDFGDIDLIIQLDCDRDKNVCKQDFAKFLSLYPDDIIVPFKSEKYKGKKYLNTGELVSVLYHIPIKGEEYVQIDNIIATSKPELEFKDKFLSIPAEKQGLMLGLVKCAALENPRFVEWYTLGKTDNQELEFNLSSSGISLRLVTLTPDYKTIDKKEVWKSCWWKLVEDLLQDYDFTQSFEDILLQINQNVKYARSLNRIKGIFNSMVSIKSGEVGTEKGFQKERALKLISKL